MGTDKRRALIIGGGFSGLFAARDLKSHFDVIVVDAKEFFEYTPGILRAYVKPAHLDALTFMLQPVLEHKMGVKFVWGEVKSLDGESQTAVIKPMCSNNVEIIGFDFCVVASGCNFNFLHNWGESLWFPTIYDDARQDSNWSHIDERFLEGRRRHILEEHNALHELNKNKATVLVCGAGFIGVEWATELNRFFPNLDITIIDFLPNCLGPLPKQAQDYCNNYMEDKGIKTFYQIKYAPNDSEFWNKINLPNKADKTYFCMGVKASNYFMPPATLSKVGPAGGKWVNINEKLQVMCDIATDDKAKLQVWGRGRVFAIGDCNLGCVGGPDDWEAGKGMAPVPKISYPSEEQAYHVSEYMKALDCEIYGKKHGWCCVPTKLSSTHNTWWPWGAGMFATSLGTGDACFVAGATHQKGSGLMCVWGWPAVIQKELIESTKIDECKDNFIGKAIWHFVHHTPILMWGKGPWFP